jgi:hypothetical protein
MANDIESINAIVDRSNPVCDQAEIDGRVVMLANPEEWPIVATEVKRLWALGDRLATVRLLRNWVRASEGNPVAAHKSDLFVQIVKGGPISEYIIAGGEVMANLSKRRKQFNPYTLARVTGLPDGYSYPFANGDTVLILGEVYGMRGHVVIADSKGRVFWGYHAEYFEPEEV